jgi:predicted nucleotidyltransferase
MDEHELQQPLHHQIITNRLIAACNADDRVVAAFLGGSYARGTNDVYSDLDFGLILTDETYEYLLADCEAFVQLLGESLFLEVYHENSTDTVFSIFSDGTEVELLLGRESHFTHIHKGPYKILLDKKDILAGAVFSWHQPTQDEQIEALRRSINWFWHDLSHHFITPVARGQLWSAYGALEDMRLTCINLARLRQDFTERAEGYEKLEHAIPIKQLAPLQASFCPMERPAMLQAALTIVRFYQEIAPSLAQEHDLPYPDELAQVMSRRLELVCNTYLKGRRREKQA